MPWLIKNNESLSPDLTEEGAQYGIESHTDMMLDDDWDLKCALLPVLYENSHTVHQVFTTDWHDPLCSQKTETKQKLD